MCFGKNKHIQTSFEVPIYKGFPKIKMNNLVKTIISIQTSKRTVKAKRFLAMKKDCSHIFKNDGGNGLVCEKCGQTISVRTYSMIVSVSLAVISVRHAFKMKFRESRNTMSNAWCCFRIGRMDRFSALDLMGYACRKRNSLDNESKESDYEASFVKLVKLIWGF